MENNLEILKGPPGNEQQIFLKGRLDANWAGHLDDYLNGLVREGTYRIVLNMNGVEYLSSAGIRILINQHKKTRKIGGVFRLEELSLQVAEVLKMVGMIDILTEGTGEVVHTSKHLAQFLEISQYRFDNEVLSNTRMSIAFNGDPDLTAASGYRAEDNQVIKFSADHYGLGIGAIGKGFEDCQSRYGEYIALGEVLAYKPSDGSKIPDYIIKTGRLEPEINALYSLEAEGSFSNRVTFDPLEPNGSIRMADLVSGFAQATGHHRFVFLLIAESDGLVGVSLSTPPVRGKKLFEFPGIRENVNFTTEPAYSRMLSVVLGFYSQDPDDRMKKFLRPVKQGSSAYLHAHAAVFPFLALHKKESSAARLVRHLFENGIVEDVLHLILDSREIAGLGDSSFKQGVAWIGQFS